MSEDELSDDLDDRLSQAMEILDSLTIDAVVILATVRAPNGTTLTRMRTNGNEWAVRGMTRHATERWLEDARVEERQFQKRRRGEQE